MYWGNITATIGSFAFRLFFVFFFLRPSLSDVWTNNTTDWCEENYQLTQYVAEFWNSLSSFSISAFALWGLWESWRLGLERRFYVWSFAMFVVGLGSVVFHGTLLYHHQMLDEVPMMWASFAWLFVLLQMKKPSGKVGLCKKNATSDASEPISTIQIITH